MEMFQILPSSPFPFIPPSGARSPHKKYWRICDEIQFIPYLQYRGLIRKLTRNLCFIFARSAVFLSGRECRLETGPVVG
jgi:hypothetical protein